MTQIATNPLNDETTSEHKPRRMAILKKRILHQIEVFIDDDTLQTDINDISLSENEIKQTLKEYLDRNEAMNKCANCNNKEEELCVSIHIHPKQDDIVLSEDLKLKTDSKVSATSIYGIMMICIGSLMYGILGILIRLAMNGRDYLPYDSNAALFLAECGKFIISFILLINFNGGIFKSILILKEVPFYQWFLLIVPAIIYSITNNLTFYVLQYMDPGSMSVLVQSKIITTAILWWYWFKKAIDRQQWIALILLCGGSMFVVWPNNNDMDGMHVKWPQGPILIMVQICLSAIAGIYTEFIYKTYGIQRSIHIDNLSMYFWGIIANIFQFYYANKFVNVSILNLFDGFNIYTYSVIIVYIIMGITVSYVIKYFDNIVKLFMSGGAIIISGMLTIGICHVTPTNTYYYGLIIVVLSCSLYKSQKRIF